MTTDSCGCCPVCAKAEDEVCGGPWNIEGRCAYDLKCLVKCSCVAGYKATPQSEPDFQPCVFPFKYNGQTYDECTTAESENGKPWCALKVDRRGEVVPNQWGDCELYNCPYNNTKCDSFNENGRCVGPNYNIPGSRKAYDLREPTVGLEPIDTCESGK